MGIFTRIKTITMAEVHALLDKVEDPICMLNQYVREMEEEIAKGQQALASQIFLEKKQAALLADTEQLIAKRTRQAKLAVEREEEVIAQLALQEKLMQEKKLFLYQEQYETIKNQTKRLSETVEQAKETCRELQQKRLLLLSRANVAQSINQINRTFASFNTDNIAKNFARAEERILMMEAQTEANHYSAKALPASPRSAIDPALQADVLEELEKLKKESKETA